VHRRVLILVTFLLTACSQSILQNNNTYAPTPSPNPDARVAMLHRAIARTEPFFRKMGNPQPGDWLTAFREPGQTFDEYLAGNPTVPTKERRKIYVLPLGNFSAEQRRVIETTTGYLAAFYGLSVESLSARPLNAVFPNVRHNKLTLTRQIKTGYILNEILVPILPADAAALIAFTDQDVYSDESMNYVFGQASVDKRVGVWSLYRLRERAGFDKFLRRTIKIATHETGHMFSMKHCTKYECVMSGTNNISETDRRPVDACPECMAKVCWLSGVDPGARYRRLAEFCRRSGMTSEAKDFEAKAAALAR
jgi:archaemetzincin